MSKKISIALLGALLISSNALAGFGLPGGVPGVSKDKQSASATDASVAQTVAACAVSLRNFNDAQDLLLNAIAKKEEVAASKNELQQVGSGDNSVKAVKKLVQNSETKQEMIKKKIAENQPLDAEQKKLAAIAAISYAKAIVGTANLVGKVKSINTSSLSITDAPGILFLVKNIPSLVLRSVSASGTVFKYLSANGVSTTNAEKLTANAPK